MSVSMAHLNIDGAQQGEYQCLDITYKQFQNHHEDTHQYAHRSDGKTKSLSNDTTKAEHDEYHT